MRGILSGGARARGAVALVLLAALAGCGSSGSSGEAGKSATQIVADAAAQLARAHSFAAQGQGQIEHHPAQLDLAVEEPSKVELGIEMGSRAAAIRVIGGSVYVKANSAFYAGTHEGIPAAAVKLLAGQWLKTSESANKLVKGLTPRTLARCLAREGGTLVKEGTASVNGQQAVVVRDKGDAPGSTPARLYVAASGTPYLLRYVATGKQQPGGAKGGECNEATEPGESGGALTFSRYNAQLGIAPPAGALELSQLVQRLEGSS